MGSKDAFDSGFWNAKRVWVTGHTGFKGAWLCAWLDKLGARVEGFSLPQPARESMAWGCVSGRLSRVADARGDVRGFEDAKKRALAFKPQIVFHLAAQAIVLNSYLDLEANWGTNVMGSLSVLEASAAAGASSFVMVTSDKCYENKDWEWGYRESDELGGSDPYSASKAACEIMAQSWRRSKSAATGMLVASARAGNVIGGGDNAPHRIVPEMLAAFGQGEPGVVRNPNATRPFQHALEPLSGYMLLARRLYEQNLGLAGPGHDSAFNFGPDSSGEKSSIWLAEHAAFAWGADARVEVAEKAQQNAKEARVLMLDSSKAKKTLGWRPTWDAAKAVQKAVEWEKARINSKAFEATQRQIEQFEQDAKAARAD